MSNMSSFKPNLQIYTFWWALLIITSSYDDNHIAPRSGHYWSHVDALFSAANPGIGIRDFAWHLAIRLKFGTCGQNWDFFGTFSTTFLIALISNWLPTFFLWIVVASILLLCANRLLWFNFEKMTAFAARTLPTIQGAQLLFLFIFANSRSPFYFLLWYFHLCYVTTFLFTTLTAESWYNDTCLFLNPAISFLKSLSRIKQTFLNIKHSTTNPGLSWKRTKNNWKPWNYLENHKNQPENIDNLATTKDGHFWQKWPFPTTKITLQMAKSKF